LTATVVHARLAERVSDFAARVRHSGVTGMRDRIEIQARCGDATSLAAGQSISIVNTHGGQVVDMWAFRANDPFEHMSMPHSMVALDRIKPAIGNRGERVRSSRMRSRAISTVRVVTSCAIDY
jgi:uncharacterized protein YcgI (DUF1989 family)